MQIEIRRTDTLRPYARNPRRNDQAVERVVASIRAFGFKIPLLVRSDGEVVDGHLRLKAAIALQLEELPVILEALDGLLRIGFLHQQQIVWNKGRIVLTRTHYRYHHEPCWYAR